MAQPPVAAGREPDVAPTGIVYARAKGANVLDVDGNRYVDLAAGFGALLLGHGHAAVVRAVTFQAERLLQALGDVYPSDAKIALTDRLSELVPGPRRQVILGQSGADAVGAALKTAALATGRPGVLAFGGAYHGLSHGPLAACGFRASYREPFRAQLSPHVVFVEPPGRAEDAACALEAVSAALGSGRIGAVLFEPILGRAGVLAPPAGFWAEVRALARAAGALLVADEIWTGLGRAGAWLQSASLEPELICLGKGLGGGLPISACLGTADVMAAWRQPAEVVHTSTFAGAPLAAAAALATLDALGREHLVERAAETGARWTAALRARVAALPRVAEVRGAGLMVGVALRSSGEPGAASRLQRALLSRGYLTTTGGEHRDTLVLTPPLMIDEALLASATEALAEELSAPA